MKKVFTFFISAAVIVCCLALYMNTLKTEDGVNFVVRSAPREELMRGNDGDNADRVQLFNGETVNINTADVKRLALLPEIGEALGERIVNYRDTNGCFESIEDIMKVEGIGEVRFEAIKELITVSTDFDQSA